MFFAAVLVKLLVLYKRWNKVKWNPNSLHQTQRECIIKRIPWWHLGSLLDFSRSGLKKYGAWKESFILSSRNCSFSNTKSERREVMACSVLSLQNPCRNKSLESVFIFSFPYVDINNKTILILVATKNQHPTWTDMDVLKSNAWNTRTERNDE